MTNREKFINENRNDMYLDLCDIVTDLKQSIALNQTDFTENKEESSIDIRLCIDLDRNRSTGSYIFRTGLSDYDQRHSRYCAASSVNLDTHVDDLLNTLTDQILEHE
jgi:hypothetical protein